MTKKTLLMLVVLGTAFIAFSQDRNALAKVQIIDGKEVYILNEPLQDYEEVAEVKTGLKITSLLTRGIWNEDINSKAAQFTRRSIKKLSKENAEFDAILYSEKKRVKAIRFNSEPEQDEERLAKVNSYHGVEVYILAEPVGRYTVTNSVRGNFKFLPFLTYGFFNPSIERDAKTFAKKVAKKNEDYRAFTYETGRSVSVIE